MLCMEDGEELDPWQPKEDQGEELENMCASGCASIDQARLTDEQAEELRRRSKAP
jgi:hypothetical protein